MIRTPYRISFFGGSTDRREWYRQHGGAVLASSISLGVTHELVGGKIVTTHDVPPGSGLGASSADTVGKLRLKFALEQQPVTPMELARMAMRIEQDVRKECVGSQDQVMAAHGGFRLVRFRQDDRIDVSTIDPGNLHDYLLLFDTGIRRNSSEVAKTYTFERRAMMRFLGMVDEACLILESGPIEDFGRLLDEAWELKRSLSPLVSSPEIDRYYAIAMETGATGGKVLGSGGGGHILFFAPRHRHVDIIAALGMLEHRHFSLDCRCNFG